MKDISVRTALAIALAWAMAAGGWSCGSGGGGNQDAATDAPDGAGDADDDADAGDGADVPDGADADGGDGDGGDGADSGCASDADCDDGDPCTSDACDEDYGTCSHGAVDADNDGYYAAEVDGTACTGNDCDDANAGANPGEAAGCGAAEDLDCNGAADADNDGDGHDSGETAPGGRDCGGDDCGDGDPAISPSAMPGCGPAEDRDCNGENDADNDGDGHDAGEAGASGRDCLGDDCDDGDAGVNPGAVEACLDGVDGDCDGIVDGLARIEAPLRVSALPGSGQDPGIAWTGSEYGVVFESGAGGDSDLYAWTLDAEGDPVVHGEPYLSGDVYADRDARPVWTGSLYLVEWMKETLVGGNPRPHLMRWDRDWIEVGTAGRMRSDTWTAYSMDVVWTGSAMAACWTEGGPNMAVACNAFDESGAALWAADAIVDAPEAGWSAKDPSIAWSGSEFAVAWSVDPDASDLGDSYVVRMAADGSGIGTIRGIAPSVATYALAPQVEWAGSGWAIAWYETDDMAVADARLELADAALAAEGAPVAVSEAAGTSVMPVLAWTGSEVVALWNDFRTSLFEMQIYARTFDGSGAATSGEVRVSATTDYSFLPAAVVAGHEIGVAWTQMAATNDAYFARLGFCE